MSYKKSVLMMIAVVKIGKTRIILLGRSVRNVPPGTVYIKTSTTHSSIFQHAATNDVCLFPDTWQQMKGNHSCALTMKASWPLMMQNPM